MVVAILRSPYAAAVSGKTPTRRRQRDVMDKKRLAIIDDDAAYLHLLCRLLAKEGYEPEMFEQLESSASAYERVLAFNPDIIVLDIALDHPTTGWRTLNFLRLDPQVARVPVVVCSSDIRELEERTWYLKAKGCVVLPKPYYLEDLLAVLSPIEIEQM
jgi:DNA-binding response OmpR family regulator